MTKRQILLTITLLTFAALTASDGKAQKMSDKEKAGLHVANAAATGFGFVGLYKDHKSTERGLATAKLSESNPLFATPTGYNRSLSWGLRGGLKLGISGANAYAVHKGSRVGAWLLTGAQVVLGFLDYRAVKRNERLRRQVTGL